MTALRFPVANRRIAALLRRGRHAFLAPSVLATFLALPLCGQNWVGFGDNAWPPANTASARGTIAATGAGELMVRLDAWEHGGWGTSGPLGTRTIDAVKFYAHTLVPGQSITLKLYNEGPVHFPGAGVVLTRLVPIPVSPVPLLVVAPFLPVTWPCTGTGDMFVSFVLAPLDGVQIGQITTATDAPGARYMPKPFGYPAPPTPSHCYSMPTVPPFPLPGYLPGPAQFYVDVGQSASLASGVGGAVTTQITLPNSAFPGTSDFLSGSFPDCTGLVPLRAPAVPDIATMKIRPPTICAPSPGSLVLFVLASDPIVPCAFEWPMVMFFPNACTTGVLCINPNTILVESVALLAPSGDTVVSYPLLPAMLGLGGTHQAFIYDPTTGALHAGPCDRMDL